MPWYDQHGRWGAKEPITNHIHLCITRLSKLNWYHSSTLVPTKESRQGLWPPPPPTHTHMKVNFAHLHFVEINLHTFYSYTLYMHASPLCTSIHFLETWMYIWNIHILYFYNLYNCGCTPSTSTLCRNRNVLLYTCTLYQCECMLYITLCTHMNAHFHNLHFCNFFTKVYSIHPQMSNVYIYTL